MTLFPCILSSKPSGTPKLHLVPNTVTVCCAYLGKLTFWPEVIRGKSWFLVRIDRFKYFNIGFPFKHVSKLSKCIITIKEILEVKDGNTVLGMRIYLTVLVSDLVAIWTLKKSPFCPIMPDLRDHVSPISIASHGKW